MYHTSSITTTAIVTGSLFLGCACSAQAAGWPEIFDPGQVLTLHLEMDDADWQTIQDDETLSIEVEAMFWTDGEDPILVSVRRKSADPLMEAPDYTKVSLKIDINEYVSGQEWHDLKKLSLENGDDQDVVSEGLAWYLHRVASGPEGYDYEYPAALASWVVLYINDVNTGVYVSVEQRDKRFLQNRGLYTEDETWLYKVGDIGDMEMKVGGPEDSPTVQALCYEPFDDTCSGPNDLATELPQYIDMQAMLALGAVDSFAANPDAIFSHGKNFYFVDFLEGSTRMHFPWDLDSVITQVSYDIYSTGSPYSTILLGVPEFRELYSRILNDLVCGPFREAELLAFLDSTEMLLTEELEADPNNQIDGSVAEFFDNRRAWISARLVNVADQIENFEPCEGIVGDITGDGVVDVLDLLELLGQWGPCPDPPEDCLADLDGNGVVDVLDLLILLGNWG